MHDLPPFIIVIAGYALSFLFLLGLLFLIVAGTYFISWMTLSVCGDVKKSTLEWHYKRKIQLHPEGAPDILTPEVMKRLINDPRVISMKYLDINGKTREWNKK